MRKGKGVLALLIFMFLTVVGLFIYNIKFTATQESKQFQAVLVAKETILEGNPIKKDDVEFLKIHKAGLSSSYHLKFEDLGKNPVAKSTILKKELVTKERIVEGKTETATHELDVAFSNKVSVKEGEFVQILVKPKFMSQVFEVYEAKKVNKLNYKVQNNGAETGIVESISIQVSDDELALYQQALSNGEIVVSKFNSVADIEKDKHILFESAVSLIERSIAVSREEGRKEGYFFVTLHQVEDGDTIDSLAEKYNVSADQIKAFNPKGIEKESIIRVN